MGNSENSSAKWNKQLGDFKKQPIERQLEMIYSELLKVSKTDEIQIEEFIKSVDSEDAVDFSFMDEESKSDKTLSFKELLYILTQTGQVKHLQEIGLTNEEIGLLISMITGYSFEAVRQALSKDWSKLTTESKEYAVRNIHSNLWAKANNHPKMQGLISKVDPIAKGFIDSKGVTDKTSSKKSDK